MQRDIDVLVWGATGFTGQICTEFLDENYANSNVKWAIAGRSKDKLAQVSRALDLDDSVEHLVADSHDIESLRGLVKRARVVLTTVGPYARYGSELVQVCAEEGTHYCDLTGEVQWMRKMIDAHQETAQESGARIVHTCGFDSIPSDLGTYFVQQAMIEQHGVPANVVKYRAKKFSGGFSGGTVDSMMAMMEQSKDDPSIARTLADPYALNPKGAERGLDGPDRTLPDYDADFDTWVGPFVMAAINTRVVRRSNALMGYQYGHDFRYDEATIMPRGPLGFAAAAGMSLGSNAMNAMASLEPTRKLMQRFMPKPGEGPSREAQEAGFFEIEILAKHPTDPGKNLKARVKGDKDPGYGSTAKMLVESALCLAHDDLATGGGFWTPSSAMGDALLKRLPANAGVTFELI